MKLFFIINVGNINSLTARNYPNIALDKGDDKVNIWYRKELCKVAKILYQYDT